MPTITDLKIQKSNKTRANLYLDGQFAFGVEMFTVMKLGLKIGMEVSVEKLQEVIFDSEKTTAFEKAMDYLGRGMKTAKQVKEYLERKGYTPNVVQYVISRLKEYRYIDDTAYAKLYVEQQSRTKGTRRLQQELQQKGISRAQAEEFGVVDGETALQNATALAQKYMKNKPADVKNLQRLQRYLLSRGYDFDVVNSVVRLFKNTDEQFE